VTAARAGQPTRRGADDPPGRAAHHAAASHARRSDGRAVVVDADDGGFDQLTPAQRAAVQRLVRVCRSQLVGALTMSTGHSAPRKMRCEVLPMMSSPTGLRLCIPITTNSGWISDIAARMAPARSGLPGS
jgi:hypothetical protein